MRSPFKGRGARLRHHATLAAPGDHDRLAAISVGPEGSATALWTDLAGLAAARPEGEAPGPVLEPSPPPVAGTVTVQRTGHLEEIRIAELTATFPMVQPLPGGRVLVVGARAEWRPEGPERNATIYGPDGSPLLSACVGDGIAHVQTTPSGAVWLGYSDEGIYGNLGWGAPGGPEPIGWSGLLQMSSRLEIAWRYPADQLQPIDDCYALNLAGEVAWACPYSSFGVTRVEDGTVRSWPSRVQGARAIVAEGERVALLGGYRGDRDRVVLGRLDAAFTEVGTTRLVMPDGAPLPAAATTVGRADELHVFVGRDWYRVGLENLAG